MDTVSKPFSVIIVKMNLFYLYTHNTISIRNFIREIAHSQQITLYVLALIHPGETPYKCDYCGEVFSIKRDLNHHLILAYWRKTTKV